MADTAEGDITEALGTISRVRNETAKASLEGVINKGTWIRLTPYMVLPLFATRLAAYAGASEFLSYSRVFFELIKMACMREIVYSHTCI